MAQGDLSDMVGRLKAALPSSWFAAPAATGAPSPTPILDGVLSGFASAFSWLFGLIQYANLQARLATTTDVFLDMAAQDFSGTRIARSVGQVDDGLRARLLAYIRSEKGTRAGVITAIETLTGTPPVIVVPSNPSDTGGYGSGEAIAYTGMAYGSAGAWGSLALPYQAFVSIKRPVEGVVASIAGYVTLGGNISGALLSTGDSVIVANSNDVPHFPSGDVIYKCTLTGTTGVVAFAGSVPQVSGQTAAASVWAYIPNGETLTSLHFSSELHATNVVASSPNLSTKGSWQRLYETHTATDNVTQLVVRASSAASGAVVYLCAMRSDQMQSEISATGGYGVGAVEWINPSLSFGAITDDEIYQAVADVIPEGTIAWTQIHS